MEEWGFATHVAETAVGRNPLVIARCFGTPKTAFVKGGGKEN